MSHAPLYLCEVIKHGVEPGATAIVPVQNHPSVDSSPSPADIAIAKKVPDATGKLGVYRDGNVNFKITRLLWGNWRRPGNTKASNFQSPVAHYPTTHRSPRKNRRN